MYCHECGTELPSAAKHCTSCGNPVQEDDIADESGGRGGRTSAAAVEQRSDQPIGSDRNQVDSRVSSGGQQPDPDARSAANQGRQRQSDGRNRSDETSPDQSQQRDPTPSRTEESTSFFEGVPLVGGLVYGSLSFLVSYLAVVGLVIVEAANNGDLDTLLESDSDLSIVQYFGWIFYSAHSVEIDVPGGQPINFLDEMYAGPASMTIPKAAYYAVPVVFLLGFGVVLARRTSFAGRPTGIDSAKAGTTLALGYLACSAVGAITVFSYELGADVNGSFGTVEPQLAPAVAIMGIAYPVVVGGIGGYLAGD